MTSFEAELDGIVSRFVAELAELARTAAYRMVIDSLEQVHRPHKSAAAVWEAKPGLGIDPGRALRAGLRRTVREFERHSITHALEKFDGNITRAAKALRIPRVSLQRTMRRLGMRPSA